MSCFHKSWLNIFSVILYQSESLKTSLAICIDQKQKDKKNKNGKGQNIPPMFLLGQVIGSNF
jgi:hypothetical protein